MNINIYNNQYIFITYSSYLRPILATENSSSSSFSDQTSLPVVHGGRSLKMRDDLIRMGLYDNLKLGIYDFDMLVSFTAFERAQIPDIFDGLGVTLTPRYHYKSITMARADDSTYQHHLSASDLLPPHIRNLYMHGYKDELGEHIELDCFGFAALYCFPDLLQTPLKIYTEQTFSRFYPYTEGATPKFGDLALMVNPKSKKWEPIHAFIYVAPNLAWSKNGRTQPICLQTTDQLRDIFETQTKTPLHTEYYQPYIFK